MADPETWFVQKLLKIHFIFPVYNARWTSWTITILDDPNLSFPFVQLIIAEIGSSGSFVSSETHLCNDGDNGDDDDDNNHENNKNDADDDGNDDDDDDDDDDGNMTGPQSPLLS